MMRQAVNALVDSLHDNIDEEEANALILVSLNYSKMCSAALFSVKRSPPVYSMPLCVCVCGGGGC
jgi:hypothetical protein